MLSPKTKRNIGRVIPFGVLWFIFSLIYCRLEKGILGHLDSYPATGVSYNFGRSIIAIPTAGMFMGILTETFKILSSPALAFLTDYVMIGIMI
ncbi:hypothetical protein [Pedobacter alluvionis]|uniref:Uncharacterized protein n=1 Tax=Pedobacter alluvionis TaxID=475253 RepID=A0A497XS05_9SPHI|nr:hypothetical protein [Pedobacter alluvionis]RLJ69578.1 hypothetical protein BCL90_5176 [Pedobacter alluvionis]TFB28361.1 hypothetical protein E3V97_23040 [Pedobacter alluvionis]